MKSTIKGFVGGVLVGTLGISTIFAAGGIKSAEFNANKVSFNGRELDLSGNQMVSIIKEGEDNASNYMPVRAVLEQMGYQVNWDGNTKTVSISDAPAKKAAEGEEYKKYMYDSLGIDPNSKEFQELFNELNESADSLGFDSATMCFMVFQDYKDYLNSEDSIFEDIWDALLEE